MSKYKFGYLKDLTDQRDKIYSAPRITTAPSSVSLLQYCAPVENQTTTSSCTAHGLVGNLEMLEKKNNTNFYDISRLFVYYNTRMLSGIEDNDGGAYIRDGIKSLVKYGYCSEKLWKYEENKVNEKPDRKSYNEAKRHLIKEYSRILNINDIIKCIASGYPVVFGISLYESFESEKVSKTEKISIPKTNESVIGRHCMLIVGYDMETKLFIVRNSWGTGWGNKRYCEIPFEYMEQADDMWTIRSKR
jgi:C1A family cysteine protease